VYTTHDSTADIWCETAASHGYQLAPRTYTTWKRGAHSRTPQTLPQPVVDSYTLTLLAHAGVLLVTTLPESESPCALLTGLRLLSGSTHDASSCPTSPARHSSLRGSVEVTVFHWSHRQYCSVTCIHRHATNTNHGVVLLLPALAVAAAAVLDVRRPGRGALGTYGCGCACARQDMHMQVRVRIPCSPLRLLPGVLPGVHSRGCTAPPAGSTPPAHAPPRGSGHPVRRQQGSRGQEQAAGQSKHTCCVGGQTATRAAAGVERWSCMQAKSVRHALRHNCSQLAPAPPVINTCSRPGAMQQRQQLRGNR
jgi:hypothetical protein